MMDLLDARMRQSYTCQILWLHIPNSSTKIPSLCCLTRNFFFHSIEGFLGAGLCSEKKNDHLQRQPSGMWWRFSRAPPRTSAWQNGHSPLVVESLNKTCRTCVEVLCLFFVELFIVPFQGSGVQNRTAIIYLDGLTMKMQSTPLQ